MKILNGVFLVGLLELEHDLVPPVPELHGAVVAGPVEEVAVHLVQSGPWDMKHQNVLE
jgi:hypothetical protein